MKNSSFGVKKFNFSLGLRLIFSCTEWINSLVRTSLDYCPLSCLRHKGQPLQFFLGLCQSV